MTIFDNYFELWDAALLDKSAVDKLINLFAKNVVVHSPKGKAKGKLILKLGIKRMLKKYVSMNHIWNATETDEGFVATWAVTHELKKP